MVAIVIALAGRSGGDAAPLAQQLYGRTVGSDDFDPAALQLDPFRPSSVANTGNLYYWLRTVDNILEAQADSGRSLYDAAQEGRLLGRLAVLANALEALEIGTQGRHGAVCRARDRFAPFWPEATRDCGAVRGWAWYQPHDYAAADPDRPAYSQAFANAPDPFYANGKGYLGIDHNDPPFLLYAIETGNALLALAKAARVIEDLAGSGSIAAKADASQAARYRRLVKDVLDYWDATLFKTHDFGDVGWCYDEFCKTETINGVPHDSDYYALNSNAMMAATAYLAYRLTGEGAYREKAFAVAKDVKSHMRLDDGAYVFDFGVPNAALAGSGHIAVVEDTAHGAWDTMVFSVLYGAAGGPIEARDVAAAAATVTRNIINGGEVNSLVNGSGPNYPPGDRRLVGEWGHLGPALARISPDEALRYMQRIKAAVESSSYGYYSYLFDSYLLQTNVLASSRK